MTISSVLRTGVFVGALWAGAAIAQNWAPPAEIAPKAAEAQAAPATKPSEQKATPAAPDGKAKQDKAKDCKAQADAKGLHGKERKKFRAECVKS